MTRGGVLLFIARRLAVLVLLLLIISVAVFSLLYIAAGNPVEILLGMGPRAPGEVRAIMREYDLNGSFVAQYWTWLQHVLQFQFGTSIQTSLPVVDELNARLPTSLFLGVYAFLLTMVLGIGMGIVAALRRTTLVDRGVVAGALVGGSTPAFVSGVILIFVFGVVLHWFPVFGRGSGFFDELWHLTLPAIAMAIVSAALLAKHTRAAMIGVLDQDYMTFARARGLSSWRILFVYSLRNALIPVVTISGVMLSSLIVGALFVENAFSIPGIGQLLVQSAQTKDIATLQAVTLMVAIIVILANLFADLGYMAVDPRVRLGKGAG